MGTFTFTIPAMFLSSCTGITLTRQNFVDTSVSNNRQPNNSNPSSNQGTTNPIQSNNQDSTHPNLYGVLNPSVLGRPDNQSDLTQHEDQNPLSASRPNINGVRSAQPNQGGSDSQNQGNNGNTNSLIPDITQPAREQTPAPLCTVRVSSYELTNTGLLGADKSEVVIDILDNKITLGSKIQNHFSTSLETSKLLEIFAKNASTYSPNFILTDKKPSDWQTYTSTNSFYVSNEQEQTEL